MNGLCQRKINFPVGETFAAVEQLCSAFVIYGTLYLMLLDGCYDVFVWANWGSVWQGALGGLWGRSGVPYPRYSPLTLPPSPPNYPDFV